MRKGINASKDLSGIFDINNVSIDTCLPAEQRIRDFVQQIGNPYCYRDGNITVKISFNGNRELTDVVADYLKTHESNIKKTIGLMVVYDYVDIQNRRNRIAESYEFVKTMIA